MRRPLRKRSISAVSVLAALAAAGFTAPAGAAPTVSTLKPSAVAASVHTVRLVTGDRVVVTDNGGGRTVAFAPDSDSPTGTASIVQHGKDVTVIPQEAAPLIDSGALDPRLFDVGALIEQGYDNGHDLPLIVQNSTASAPAPADSREIRRLSSLRATAARVRSEKTQSFWAGLRTAKSGATARKLGSGVRKIWLDAKVSAALDQSVPQIGAPTAWAAGYDGKGVKVAVLDTGIDATHPDLSDRIDEARNFSDSADTVDRFGHGTHVADTIVGSGAASGGKYKGVAPGARLLIGKVLGDNGSGSDSTVLAGMEWAAHSGAKVVSMSLGADTSTDGTDPMSQAVNDLTKETGTLFVIAAGNSGPDATTLGTPGSADAALTVAAVDKQDKIAPFSSRGPRFGDNALKPDIAAPGVNIVAARAAGTAMGTPVDADYTSASGTSMATPHVSGAAAIIAQEHPDWSAADIKGALMSSAKVLPDGAFAEGSGRVDLTTAIHASVWATNTSFGRFAQGAVSGPVTRTVTFHNTADTAVTLALTGALSRDGGGTAIPGALTLGSDSVTLPAGGSQDVQVTAAPDLATTGGTYTGTVIATGEGVTAHATVTLTRDLPTYKVGLKTLMADGTAPTSAAVSLYNLRKNDPPTAFRIGADGTGSAQLVAGRYTILGHVFKGTASVTFELPDVDVTDHGLDLAVDGRKAALITTVTPKPSEPRGMAVSVLRQSAEQSIGVNAILAGGPGAHYVMPSASARDGLLSSTVSQDLSARPISARADLPGRDLDLTTQFISASARFSGSRKLSVVDAGSGSAADLAAHDVTGKLALVRVGSESLYTALPRVAAAGASAVMLVNSSDDPFAGGVALKIPAFSVPRSEGDKVAASVVLKATSVRLTGEIVPSYSYHLINGHDGALPVSQTYAPRQSQFADVLAKDYSPAPAGATGLYSQGSWVGQSTVTGSGIGNFDEVNLGTSSHAYLLAADTKWSRQVVLSGYLSAQMNYGPTIVYKAGSHSTQEWFKPVLHAGTPNAVTDPTAGLQPYRKGDLMVVTIPKYVTGVSNVFEYGGRGADGDASEFRLYRDGTLLGSAPSAWVAINNLPQEKSRYRIEMDAQRANRWWSVSTDEHTAWSFDSARTDSAVNTQLPLLQADYDLAGVRLDSSVKGRSDHRVTVSFRNPDGTRAALTKGSVQVSYDEGLTWRTVSAKVSKGAVTGTLRAPAGATGVSLRIHGENAAGSTIDQTVIHAVHVR
ncbi:S8 family serine peptidase [Streptomyces sp. NBC_01465]|uniref:S8 family serine peptidase n=1 Tax=Streptomyces sp. NBC_01465 TaxID=2903878 RepID=UPI002E2EF128|nr:S8 family serine peptidase [Streptomyces sp. NBC_01465]